MEIACGTGVNFPHYHPEGCRITAIDVSPAMLEVAERPAEKLGSMSPSGSWTETLEFPDESFDTMVSSLALCTFPDPLAALGELKRVCRIDGRLLLLEHGRSGRGWLGRFQDRREDAHAERFGCYWNREPLELVEEAGLKPISTRLAFLGILREIEARRLE